MVVSSILIALGALAIIFAGALAGIAVGRRLPEHHLAPESKAAVSVSMAVVGTMTALVLGLLISSTNTSFRARSAGVAQLASAIIELDGLMRRFGPDGEPVRERLRAYAAEKMEELFPEDRHTRPELSTDLSRHKLTEIQDGLFGLKPGTERQAWLKDRALQHAAAIEDARAELIRQDTDALPTPFLGAVVLWLTILFASFGLFAPRNLTVFVSLFLCAFAIASAIKLILDMDTSFGGQVHFARPPLHIPNEPLAHAIDQIGRPL